MPAPIEDNQEKEPDPPQQPASPAFSKAAPTCDAPQPTPSANAIMPRLARAAFDLAQFTRYAELNYRYASDQSCFPSSQTEFLLYINYEWSVAQSRLTDLVPLLSGPAQKKLHNALRLIAKETTAKASGIAPQDWSNLHLIFDSELSAVIELRAWLELGVAIGNCRLERGNLGNLAVLMGRAVASANAAVVRASNILVLNRFFERALDGQNAQALATRFWEATGTLSSFIPPFPAEEDDLTVLRHCHNAINQFAAAISIQLGAQIEAGDKPQANSHNEARRRFFYEGRCKGVSLKDLLRECNSRQDYAPLKNVQSIGPDIKRYLAENPHLQPPPKGKSGRPKKSPPKQP